ncbi:MAG TPA: hypothetical protein VGG18_12080 [Granulicella sp.]
MDFGPLIVGFTFCWITWVIFSSLRRYLLGKSQAALQEKVFSRIDSVESMLALAANDSGRKFLESLTIERSEPFTPHTRILYGIQAGIVLASFGFAMLYLHHAKITNGPELLVFGTGAVGLGIGFLIASAASLWLSRLLGLMDHDRRG